MEMIIFAVVSLAGLLLVSGCGTDQKASASAVRRVDAVKFESLMQQGQPVILDVRTPEEYAAGHIPGATNINVLSPDFAQKIHNLSTNSVYLVYCRSGRRSQRACSLMNEAGFGKLDELASGFKGWQAAGKPVER